MTDVQVAVGFRGKTRDDLRIATLPEIVINDLRDEVRADAPLAWCQVEIALHRAPLGIRIHGPVSCGNGSQDVGARVSKRAGMATHHFRPDHYHVTIGSHDAVLRIADGDTVVTTTVDARGGDASGRNVTPGGNPQTGPFFVEGAEAGDTLAVRFERLVPNRSTGFSRIIVAPNVVDPYHVSALPAAGDEVAEWSIDRDRGTVTLLSPGTALGRLTLPLAPMLGCFGVAPPLGQAISTATSARARRQHGLSRFRDRRHRLLSRLCAGRAAARGRRARRPGRRRDRRHRCRDVV